MSFEELQKENDELKSELQFMRKGKEELLNLIELLRKENEMLKSQAERDSLTGLLNRRGMRLKLNKMGQIAYSVVMCDIDNFKSVNDNFGHPEGDHAIQMVGEILESLMRSEDYVGRFGGDEFLILLGGCDAEDAKKKCELIQRIIEMKRLQHEIEVPLTLSFGISHCEPGMKYEEAREQADKALYYSKTNGKDSITVYGNGRVK